MLQYEIAGFAVNVHSENFEPFNRMEKFLLTQHRDGDLNFMFETKKFIEEPEGNIISDENVNLKWVRKTSEKGGYYLYVRQYGVGKITVLMEVDLEWRQAVITWCDFRGHDLEKIFNSQKWLYTHIMMGIVFRYYIMRFGGLVIHSSTLKWNGKGLMFAAPSGTGKSTHVKLWQGYIDDVIVLNDDTPAVRIINDKLYVFGTPWSGSSFIHSNESAPLEAIILLEQASNNKIRRLNDQEIILKLMPRIFLPYFDQDMMDKACNVLDKIITLIPIYLMQCRADREAVEMVYQCVK